MNKNVGQDHYRNNYDNYNYRRAEEIKRGVDNLLNKNAHGGGERPRTYVEVKLGFGQGGYDLNHRGRNQSHAEKANTAYQKQKAHEAKKENPSSANDPSKPNNQKKPPPNSDTPNDTGSARRNKQEKETHNNYQKWEEKKSDSNATEEDKQKAKNEFYQKFDEWLEQDQKDKEFSQAPNCFGDVVDHLNNVANSCNDKIQKAQEQIAKGQKQQEKAERLSNAAEDIEKQLGNEKIEIKDKNGVKKKVNKEEAKKAADNLKEKANKTKIKGDQNVFDGKWDSAYNGAKGSMAKELGKQIVDAKTTYGSAVALGGVDSAFDWAEGKCDLKTAVTNTVMNSATGTLTYAASSVGYEGVKGALTATVTNGVDKLPALGTVMKVYQVSSVIIHAENASEACQSLLDFGIDAGGEAALLAGITFATGGAGLPAMIGAKVAWRSLKYGWSCLV